MQKTAKLPVTFDRREKVRRVSKISFGRMPKDVGMTMVSFGKVPKDVRGDYGILRKSAEGCRW